MNIIDKLKERARSDLKTIVLPESTDERILQAADYIDREKIARIILLGPEDKILAGGGINKNNFSNIDIIDYLKDTAFEDYVDEFYQLRQHKGITYAAAKQVLQNPVYFAAMMVRKNLADGFVAGAVTTTSEVAKAAIYCLGVNSDVRTVSSCFLIIVPECRFGEEGVFVFADCGIVREPTAKQLADIAITSAKLFRQIIEKEPKVAMLSFSTKGSGGGESVDKVIAAKNILQDIAPDLFVDGELQADAAIVPAVAKRKVNNSPVAGYANVLIFPNLDAGNIAYKLVQRLAKASAIGPILEGLNYPCSDLSRGCSVQDIVNVVAVTAVRAH
ncbi:MAG: phosphate acetyltransferase [Candidatus Omnitrophota bacterium]